VKGGMKQISSNPILYRANNYVKKNWGSPFIVMFMLLLISAAISISSGLLSLADNIAIYAFYALVIGVTLQLVCFLKYGKKSEVDAIQ
jgi:hypothetical protein